MTPILKTLTGATALASSAFFTTAVWAADELKIGYLVAKSGPFVSLSKTNTIGAQIAVDEINANGGINGKTLVLVEFDTAGNPAQAVVGLRQLSQDENVLAIVGPFSSSEAKVAFPQAERAGIVSMSMASSAPKLAEQFSYGFRNTTNEGIMISRAVATLKAVDPDAKTSSIAYATDDAVSVAIGTKILPVVLGKAELPVQNEVSFKYAAFDLSVQASQLMETKADVVAVGAPPEAAIKLANEMRRQGHEGRLVAGSTVFDVTLPERMGEAGVGSVFPTAFYWDLNDETKAFAAEFKSRAEAQGIDRTVPAQFDSSTYGIVKMFAAAMEQANVTGDAESLEAERTAIRDNLSALKNFPTIEGPISIGADGDALKSTYVMEITADGWKLLETHR
jgi:branched-chain amino acid transport system substrate-binding protein